MEPIINLKNHDHFTSTDDRWDSDWNSCVKANESINIYLDQELYGENRYDWAGKYHSFLSLIGLPPETENGWWSKSAIDMKNLRLFIDLMNEDGDQDGEIEPSEKLQAYYDLKQAKAKMKEAKSIILGQQ